MTSLIVVSPVNSTLRCSSHLIRNFLSESLEGRHGVRGRSGKGVSGKSVILKRQTLFLFTPFVFSFLRSEKPKKKYISYRIYQVKIKDLAGCVFCILRSVLLPFFFTLSTLVSLYRSWWGVASRPRAPEPSGGGRGDWALSGPEPVGVGRCGKGPAE